MAQGRSAVSVIEAAYAIDAAPAEWLAGLTAAAEPEFARGFGTCAYLYDASSHPLRVLAFHDRKTPFSAADCAAAVAQADERYIEETWRTLAVAAGSETPGYRDLPVVKDFFLPLGVRDFFAINGADSSGVGIWLGAPLPYELPVTAAMRRTWSRVAAHLAAGLRIGRTVHRTEAAVLSTTGRVEHAEGDAKLAHAREALHEAVRRVERARGRLRHRDPEGAVELWQTLVSGRWSLVDRFERGGRRWVIAVENEPRARGPEVLTPRERHVLAAAALGRTNKLIAYELGLSDSTVRVLLARAARKLDVATRRELIALYRAHARVKRPT
jgi:DNA-binding CsgD family transcriptional regulator